MCIKGQTKAAAAAGNSPRILLASVDCFSVDGKRGPPLPIEMITTGLIFIGLLVTIEYNLGKFLFFMQVSDHGDCEGVYARHFVPGPNPSFCK